MIMTLKIKCVAGPFFGGVFERTVEVPESMTLRNLHDLIQELTQFADDHLYSFFVGKNIYNRNNILYEIDGMGLEKADKSPKLSSIFPLPEKEHLFYWFDFGDDWMFKVTANSKSKPEKKGVMYPQVIKEVGAPPEQYCDEDDDDAWFDDDECL